MLPPVQSVTVTSRDSNRAHEGEAHYIGILDIFGFEVFDINRLVALFVCLFVCFDCFVCFACFVCLFVYCNVLSYLAFFY